MDRRAVRLAFLPVVALVAASGTSYAQQVISAQSGTVHYTEGSVYADGRPIEHKFAQFTTLKDNEELRTADGRAEVLLTPGAFLRLVENSSVRMLSNRLSDTRMEVLSGSVMLECAELLPGNALSLVYHGNTIKLEKRGLYRLDADWARFRVYDGEAAVQSENDQLALKKGKETGLNGVLQAEHFDTKIDDSLLAWSRERSGYLAYASASAAQSLRTSGNAWIGGWGWSPLLDEFTFVPGRGVIYSPFGWQYWSPLMTGVYYYVPPSYYTGPYGGGGTVANWNGSRGPSSGGVRNGNIGAAAGAPTARPVGPVAARHGSGNAPGGGGFASAPRTSFGGGGSWGGGRTAPSGIGAAPSFGGASAAHAGGGASRSGGATSSGTSAK
jgi:hypothetical protein